jgi:hypothetical protein
VRLAHKLAIESDLVRADMVESAEFPQLTNKYAVMAVPKTVVNERVSFEGGLPESHFVEAVMQAVKAAS